MRRDDAFTGAVCTLIGFAMPADADGHGSCSAGHCLSRPLQMTQPPLSAVARHNWSKPNGSPASRSRRFRTAPRASFETIGGKRSAGTGADPCQPFLAGPAPAPSPWGLGESVRPFASGVVVGGSPPDGESGRGPVVCKSATFDGPVMLSSSPCSRACVEASARLRQPPCHEGPLLGRARLAARARAADRTLRRQHLLRRGALRRRAPASIIDAGTGIRKLGKELMPPSSKPGTGTRHLLISHTHWDHIQGLPFFAPLYQQGNQLSRLRPPARRPAPAARCSPSQTDAPYFPVPFDEARGRRRLPRAGRLGAASRSTTPRSRARASTTRTSPPPTALTADGAKVAYVSDTAPFTDILFERRVRRAAAAARRRAARRRPAEAASACATAWCACARARTWSSTTPCSRPRTTSASRTTATRARRRASRSAGEAGARRLALFHHAPERSDDEVDAILADTRERSARDGAPRWTSSPPTKGWTSTLGQRLMEVTLLGRARLDPGARAGDGPLRRQHLLRVGAPDGGELIILDCGTGRAQPGHQPAGGPVRPGPAARRRSCCRTPTGTTSRASRSSCRSTSPGNTLHHLRRRQELAACSRRCSRGRWRRSISRCRRSRTWAPRSRCVAIAEGEPFAVGAAARCARARTRTAAPARSPSASRTAGRVAGLRQRRRLRRRRAPRRGRWRSTAAPTC